MTGDRYGGDWPREQFRNRGIQYEASDLAKTDLYRKLLPSINSVRIDLLDHPPQGHDDLANVVAGLNYVLEEKKAEPFMCAL